VWVPVSKVVLRFEEKLNIWKNVLLFDSQIMELQEGMLLIKTAAQQIFNSKALSEMLCVVLALGNLLNDGSNLLGGARGFRLEALLKLKDVHTSNGKGSLLHVLVDIIETKYPQALGFYNEIGAVEQARRSILRVHCIIGTNLLRSQFASF
jgi:hypothetical protein